MQIFIWCIIIFMFSCVAAMMTNGKYLWLNIITAISGIMFIFSRLYVYFAMIEKFLHW